MPLVFVHGVGNRNNSEDRKKIKNRNAFFRETILQQVIRNRNARIFNPLWGINVPEIPEDNPIIPPPQAYPNVERFGSNFDLSSDSIPAIYVGNQDNPNKKLISLAKQSFPNFIDQLLIEAVNLSEVERDNNTLSNVVKIGISASEYSLKNPSPDWINDAVNDSDFIDKLIEAIENWNQQNTSMEFQQTDMRSFGAGDKVFNYLIDSAQRTKQNFQDIPTNLLLRIFRPSLTQRITRFVGDVFYYQTTRGTREQPGDIVKVILEDLREARQLANDSNELLIVVGHSMGGNILYDVLTYFEPTLQVDIFVTVGCQASLFKQLQLFTNQQIGQMSGGFGQAKAPKPLGVDKWFNIFDPQDILGFAFNSEFEGVEDFCFESPGGILTAHGDYFARISFYERLAARIVESQ
ncbi:MAG: hypothetical protein AB4368_30790 [Xenococcaceae cyanobacterium]